MQTKEQILRLIQEMKLLPFDHPEYWTKCIMSYRETGSCGSVNFSTVEFIPVISKLLETIEELRSDDLSKRKGEEAYRIAKEGGLPETEAQKLREIWGRPDFG